MKLLMITGEGGVGLAQGKKGAFHNTIEEFRKHWDRVDIICPRSNAPIFNPFDNVFIHSSPWPKIFQPVFISIKGKEIFLREKFDRFVVHDYPPFYSGVGAMFLKWRTGIPYMYEIFHIPGYPKAASFKGWIYKWMTRICVGIISSPSSVVRVMNKKQVPDFLSASGVPRKKMSYIPAIYIDREVFKPLNLNKDFDVIFVGRLEKNKGIFILLDALKSLYSVRAVIVGVGPLSQQVKDFIGKNKMEGRVILHGWAKDNNEVAGLINRSKILVAPSFNEGGPRVVVEALACGVPFLATDVGIVSSLDGLSGDIVTLSPQDISSKILKLLDDKEKYSRYSSYRLRGLDEFDKIKVLSSYADTVKSII